MRNRVACLSEFLRNPKGSMTVEFVAFVPMLIAALVISFEFGRALWAYDVITRDLRGSVRYLARNSATPPPYAGNVCPTTAQNIAQTGSPTDAVDANKHFPWQGAAATFSCTVARSFNGVDYNDAGNVIAMSASVPVTLSLLQAFNQLTQWTYSLRGRTAPAATLLNYSLSVSYEARYMGN